MLPFFIDYKQTTTKSGIGPLNKYTFLLTTSAEEKRNNDTLGFTQTKASFSEEMHGTCLTNKTQTLASFGQTTHRAALNTRSWRYSLWWERWGGLCGVSLNMHFVKGYRNFLFAASSQYYWYHTGTIKILTVPSPTLLWVLNVPGSSEGPGCLFCP